MAYRAHRRCSTTTLFFTAKCHDDSLVDELARDGGDIYPSALERLARLWPPRLPRNRGPAMGMSNAEKQARWRDRNVVSLTADARDIAAKLIWMDDQKKLRKVASYVNDHLRHPDRDAEERAIALGQVGYMSLDGPLSKTAAIKRHRNPEPEPDHSWRVEAITKDGRRWSSGVRLATREEAEVYVQFYAAPELAEVGYVTGEVVRDDKAKWNCSITRNKKGGRPILNFTDGECVLLHWHSGDKSI